MRASDNSKKALLEFAEQLKLDQQAASQPDDSLLRIEALWGIVSEHLGIAPELLEERVALLRKEQEANSLDEAAVVACVQCGRSVRNDRKHCFFCGADEQTAAQALESVLE